MRFLGLPGGSCFYIYVFSLPFFRNTRRDDLRHEIAAPSRPLFPAGVEYTRHAPLLISWLVARHAQTSKTRGRAKTRLSGGGGRNPAYISLIRFSIRPKFHSRASTYSPSQGDDFSPQISIYTVTSDTEAPIDPGSSYFSFTGFCDSRGSPRMVARMQKSSRDRRGKHFVLIFR